MLRVTPLFLVITAIAIVSVQCDCGPWIPINITTVPAAKPSDPIDIVYLVAPLLECDYGNEFANFAAYHAGVALRNKRTGESITLNYDASPSFVKAIIPGIIDEGNGTVHLEWLNYGKVFIYEGVNSTYWNAERLTVATTTGDVFNEFLKWLATCNDTYIYYDIWTVYTGWPGKILMENYECFSWTYDALTQLAKLGVKWKPGVEVKSSFISLYANEKPVKVDTSNPEDMKKIITFYETLEAKIDELGFVGFLKSLWEIFINGEFYVRKDSDYYSLTLTDFPYFGVHYISVPLPKP